MFFKNNDFINFFIYTYQVAVFLYAVSKCLKEERKKDRVRWAVSFFIFMIIRLILGCLLDGDTILTVETHSICFFLICGIVYRKRLYEAMVAYSLCYYEYFMYSVTKYIIFGQEVDLTLRNSISGLILMTIYLYVIRSIVEIYDNIKNKKPYIFLIIILSFVLDIFLFLDEISSKNKVRNLELVICNLVLLFLIMNVAYFGIRYFKVRKIVRLNSKLNYMNNELRNIKDYHGKVFDDMYSLYKKGNTEEIGQILKKIINNDNKEIKNFKLKRSEDNSILYMTLVQAIKDGISVNIDEEYSLELVDIDKMELYRIISNITNNARRFVGRNGMINAKTYKEKDRIIIIIENNGPPIKKSQIDKIFLEGFTTKSNHDKGHGYGLNIVKELVEKNNGIIEVNSTNLLTSFKISLPCS